MPPAVPATVRRCALALACLPALWPTAAWSVEASPETLAALRAEIAALQARLAALEARAAEPAEPAEAASAPKVDAAPPEPVIDVGGRLHYDVYAHDTDRVPATSGSEIRRARVHVEGEASGWGWRVQAELSARTTDLRDVYLRRSVGANTLTIGQFKPFRSMDELTSSNDGTTMERGFVSGAGLFADRPWQQGVGVAHRFARGSLSGALFSLREDNSPRNEGLGASARGTWVPVLDAARLVHLGAWYSVESGGEGTPAITYDVAYGGRRGPQAVLFESLGGPGFEQRTGGLEFAGRSDGFHWQGEWSRASVAGAQRNGELEASYLQMGYLFGGVREYDVAEGVFGSPEDVGEGLWEVVARVDHLRLRDGAAARRFVLGTNWYVNEHLRLMLNWTRGEDEATGDEPSQLAFRTQYVF